MRDDDKPLEQLVQELRALRQRVATLEQAEARRGQAPERIPEKEDHLRLLVEQLPIALWATDTDLRVTDSVGAGLAAIGLHSQQLVGSTLFDYFQTDDPDFWMIARHRRALAGESLRFESEWQGRSYQTRMEPLRLANGVIFGSVGIAIDVTELKQAEEGTRKSHERFELAAQAVNCLIYDYDFPTGAILRTDGLFALTGYHPAEVPATKEWWAQRIHPEDQRYCWPAMEAAMVDPLRDRFDLQYRVRHRDGHYVYVWDHALMVRDAQGHLLRLVGSTFDITERKLAQDELRDSEERFQKFMNYSPACAWIKDDQFRYVYANRRAEECLNRPSGTWRGLTDADLFGANADLLQEHDRAALAAGKVLEFTEVLPTPDDGQTHHWLVYKFPMRGPDERCWIGGMAFDITDRKKNEQVVSKLASIIECSQDAIISRTLDGIMTSWNAGAERLYGYTAQEIIGQHISVFFPPDRGNEMADIIATTKRGERIAPFDTIRRTKSGMEVHVSVSISPIRDLEGHITGISAIAQDITERKRAEQRLAAQQATTMILAAAKTFEEAAPRLLQAIGQNLRWVSGRLWQVARPASELRRVADWPALPTLGGRQERLEPDGSLANRCWRRGEPIEIAANSAPESGWHVGFAVPLRVHGEVFSVMEFYVCQPQFPDDPLKALSSIASQVEQFIERKKAEEALRHTEEQLRQAQKMEAIGRLAGGVAHDFNNLLTAITGYSELILANLNKVDPVYEDACQIRDAAERAARLTKQLLAFSRKQILAPKVIDLNHLIAGMEQMLRRLIGEDVELRTSFGEHLQFVRADPGQIEQVILNLAINARAAMPQGGSLSIETRNADREEAPAEGRRGPFVLVMVTDTGHGMSEDIRARVFEPFFTTKDVGQGTGLGLAMVYGIVQQSGGQIELVSKPGYGTKFTIYLPSVSIGPDGERANTPQAPPKGSETILLVEDEEIVRGLACRILRQNGYRVLEAHNGAEALDLSRSEPGKIDLLITDVVMPQMSGRQLAERLAELRPEVKLLYLSGYTDDAVIRHGVLEAETSFLQKPFTPQAFVTRVREVLDRE